MQLPFALACSLLKYLHGFVKSNTKVELSMRCALVLLSLHHSQIVSNQSLVDTLQEMRGTARSRLRQMKDDIGFNIAGLKFALHHIEETSTLNSFGPQGEGGEFATTSAADAAEEEKEEMAKAAPKPDLRTGAARAARGKLIAEDEKKEEKKRRKDLKRKIKSQGGRRKQ
jgi:U3 small nucleolar RNA-associated protein 12